MVSYQPLRSLSLTLIVGLALVGCGAPAKTATQRTGATQPAKAAPGPARAKGLESYAEKDLRKLDRPAWEEFRRQLHSLTGDAPTTQEYRSLEPWVVEKFSSGGAAWLVAEAYPGYDVPDVSYVQVHVFDKDWKRIF